MSGCTVFVFLSLMEYALVNIVMGDIADIEKKKSMGISNLILGSAKPGTVPAAGVPGSRSLTVYFLFSVASWTSYLLVKNGRSHELLSSTQKSSSMSWGVNCENVEKKKRMCY